MGQARPYDVVKRVLDLCFGLVVLLILSPVLLVVALLIRVIMGSPVLFRQERPGRDGKPFVLYKFRTMTMSEPGECVHSGGAAAAVATDSVRLTGLGRFLRVTSLDEIPELFNIVCGDMSFVGPRPLLVEYLPLYSDEQARRHEVRPGLTGLAQVSGRNALDWESRFKLDVDYVNRRSLGLDLRILGQTVAAVLRREGISGEGSATMQPFTGNDL